MSGDDRLRGVRGTKDASGPPPSAATYAGLGFQLVGGTLFFLWIGWWIDSKLGTDPWLLILGAFLGFAAGFYSIYTRLMKEQAREEAARRETKGEGEGEGERKTPGTPP